MDLFTKELKEQRNREVGNGRLSKKHLEDLRASGLTEETIEEAGLVTVSPEAAKQYLRYPAGSPCLVFEYPTPSGSKYCRLKPERPLMEADGDERKYLAPRNQGNRLYVPQILGHEFLTETGEALIITEGEKKALKACQEDYKAVSLPGVWCWRTRTEDGVTGETRALEDLDCITWDGRDVYIIYDSDAAKNPDVENAEEALARELGSRGARTLVVRLPPACGPATGLDDFLVAEGNQALIELLKAAWPPVGTYFRGRTFIPLRAAGELENRDRYIFARDPETSGGSLYRYRDGAYRRCGSVGERIQELLAEETRTHRVTETEDALKRDCAVDTARLNPRPLLVNVQNGMLDPFEEKLHPHSPDCFSTIQLPVEWNPHARSRELDRFLDTICGKWASAICELAGYLLVPVNHIKKFFIFHGDTNTGKTTLINLLLALIGWNHCANISLQAIGDPSQRFAVAELEGKLVNVFDDLSGQRIDDPETIKVLTGGIDRIQVERKYQAPYKIKNTCRHLYSCNELPNCADKNEAWYERLAIFPFTHRLSAGEKDPQLREKFGQDEGIRRAMLLKAVKGLQRLTKRDWRLEGDREELADYKERNDPVMAFIAERCEQGTGKRVKRKDLYAAYEKYCLRHNLFRLGSSRKFYDRIRSDKRFTEKKSNGTRYFCGLTLDKEKTDA